MDLVHLRILINELKNKGPYVVPQQAALIILESKPALCMSKNGKDTKQTSHSYRIINLVRNGEECILKKTVWCKGGLKMVDIGTKNVRKD